MKRLIVFLLGIAIFTVTAMALPQKLVMESLSMYSNTLGSEVKFSVILPDGYYEGTKSYPVVYLLHGLGDDETSWLEYGRAEQISSRLNAAGEIVPMIFIMPQGFRSYYVNDFAGKFNYEDMLLYEMVPHIDKLFRTIPDAKHRAVTGYSMGGFGAMVLHLAHPGIFGSSAPISMSVRTDQQYKTEEAPGWDEQWGRLFGAPGIKGNERITDYYKKYSPFHTIPLLADSKKEMLRIYMVNGDDEQTLCRSNEELHMLMHSCDVPHNYRVENGGHSFRVWKSALADVLRYFSDIFEDKPYRGDAELPSAQALEPGDHWFVLNHEAAKVHVLTPQNYAATDRKYPVLWFAGLKNEKAIAESASMIYEAMEEGVIAPAVVVFLPFTSQDEIKSSVEEIGKSLRIRPGYRFAAIAGYGESANAVLGLLETEKRFCSCLLSSANLSIEDVESRLIKVNRERLSSVSLFIDAPDNGKFVAGNGTLHMMLRDMGIEHEYRVRQGDGREQWVRDGLQDALYMISERFHR